MTKPTKNHILSEIRRTAVLNGGKPPGQERFYVETGIKMTEWSGKYWARWSDAVKEAGCKPNRMQSAIPRDVLVEKCAALVRELGHFPVSNELRLKARTDSSFPSHTTIGRLGGMEKLKALLRQFFVDRGEADMAVLCNPVAVQNSEEDDLEDSDNVPSGFVYLLKMGKHYKIGRSNSVGRRQYELAIQMPEKTQLIHQIQTDDPEGIERYWHQRFADRNTNAEWFSLTSQDIQAFKRRKFM